MYIFCTPSVLRDVQHGTGHGGNGQTITTNTTPKEGTAGEFLDTVLSRREVAYSVGIMNLFALSLGVVCPIVMVLVVWRDDINWEPGMVHRLFFWGGTVKMTLALTLGAAVLHILDAFPLSVLGVMMAMVPDMNWP